MKELSIEEKARRYDESLERANKVLLDCTPEEQNVVEYITPELKESEDERIRKEIRVYFATLLYDDNVECPKQESLERWIAWLEKQGEQKPADNVELKFKAGDKVLVDGKVYTIKLVNEDNYIVDENGRDVQEHFSYTKDWKLYEQKPTAWSEEDETALGDALWCCKQAASIAKNENDMGNVWYAETWLKAIKDRVLPQSKEEWSEEDKKHVKSILLTIECCKAQFPNAQAVVEAYNADMDWLKSIKYRIQPQLEQDFTDDDKEQIKKISEAINNYYPYNESSDMRMWLNSIKDRIEWLKSIISRQQPKQEWSEEDNAMLISIENILIGRGHSFHDKEINWLKSLRPQSQWKPSKEQVETLEAWLRNNRYKGDARYCYPIFDSLYEQLKKLMEE